MVTLQTLLGSIVEGARRIAPYLLTELLLPGGTVLVVLLFLARRRRARLARARGCAVRWTRNERDEQSVVQLPRAA